MNLIRFAEPIAVQFKKSAGVQTITFEAGRDYIIANAQLERLFADKSEGGDAIRKRLYKITKLESRLQNFHVGCIRQGARRVLLYNGSAGYGDQIMTWPVAKLLHQMGFEVHVLTEPGNHVCWWNFPWIKTINPCPLPWEQAKLFDYFLVYEAVANMDEHPDQEHPVDIMLRKIGIDPAKVDPQLKTVRPNFTHTEMGASIKYKDKNVGIYQLSSTNPVRCLPAPDSVFMLMKMAEARPDIHWLAIYDEFNTPAYREMLQKKIEEEKITNIELFTTQNLRELWALTERAKIVVSPDSMMVHVAGCLSVPCVGLWGPISPDRRVAYYQNHFPIHHREFCPHCPCFCYASAFPKYCPPRANRQVCEVLAGISPTEVIEKVNEALLGALTPPLALQAPK